MIRNATHLLNEYVQKSSFAGSRLKTPPIRIAVREKDKGLIGAANLIAH